MLLDPKRTVDPRDDLDKAHRRELLEFARANGLDVDESMPASDIEGRPGTGLRSMLRAKGLTRIRIPHRSINIHGAERTFPMKSKAAPTAPAATADEWEEFQRFKAWKATQQQPAPIEPTTQKPASEINTLRNQCKVLGIKVQRTDNLSSLREKLKAHGQDASSSH